MKDFLQAVGRDHIMYVILAVTVLLVLWSLERKSKDRHSSFSFDELLTENGKTSKAACVMFGAFAFSIWLMVFLALKDKMSEGYFGAFLTAWVAPAVTKIIKGSGASPPSDVEK